MSEGLRSGELAEAAGVNPQTLRYYERRGLLSEIEAKIAGLRAIAAGLRAALDAGCDDLATCATTDCCRLGEVTP